MYNDVDVHDHLIFDLIHVNSYCRAFSEHFTVKLFIKQRLIIRITDKIGIKNHIHIEHNIK